LRCVSCFTDQQKVYISNNSNPVKLSTGARLKTIKSSSAFYKEHPTEFAYELFETESLIEVCTRNPYNPGFESLKKQTWNLWN
jgi:hypothetical protein